MTDSNHYAVKLNTLSKTFLQGNNAVIALNQVSLKINRGEFVTVMGASGSGKSTLLHVLAGLLKPDDGGDISVIGENVLSLKEKKITELRLEKIGLVFQNYNLVRSLNVTENIRLPLLLLKNSREKEKQIPSLIEKLGLSERSKYRPPQLSGGEQQRVAIGRAIITEPELILADEPTGNLDLAAGKQICKLLRKLCDEMNLTIVMVTHEPHIAFHADRIIMLAEGKIVSDLPKKNFQDSVELSVHYQKILQGNIENN